MKKIMLLSFLFLTALNLDANLIEQFMQEDLTIAQTEKELQSIEDDSKHQGINALLPSFFVGSFFTFLNTQSWQKSCGGGILGSVIGYVLCERIYWLLNHKRGLMNEKLAHLLLQANIYDKKLLTLIDTSKNTNALVQQLSIEYATSQYPLTYACDELTSIISYIDSVHNLFVEILETHDTLDQSARGRIQAYCAKIDGSMPYIRTMLSGLKGHEEFKKEALFKKENDLKDAKLQQVREETLAAQARAQADRQRARSDAELAEAHKAHAKKTNAETTKTWLEIIFGKPAVKVDVTHR